MVGLSFGVVSYTSPPTTAEKIANQQTLPK